MRRPEKTIGMIPDDESAVVFELGVSVDATPACSCGPLLIRVLPETKVARCVQAKAIRPTRRAYILPREKFDLAAVGRKTDASIGRCWSA